MNICMIVDLIKKNLKCLYELCLYFIDFIYDLVLIILYVII